MTISQKSTSTVMTIRKAQNNTVNTYINTKAFHAPFISRLGKGSGLLEFTSLTSLVKGSAMVISSLGKRSALLKLIKSLE